MPLFLLFLKKEGKRRGKIYKGKSQLSVLLIIGLIFCGMDGTRTRDPLRDRQVF